MLEGVGLIPEKGDALGVIGRRRGAFATYPSEIQGHHENKMGGEYDQEVPRRVFRDGSPDRRNFEPHRPSFPRKVNDACEGQDILCASTHNGKGQHNPS